MKKLHKLRNQKGFTIVELLIVIVVIGILAALVLNAFSGVQAKARDTKRQTDIRAIASQLEAGYNGSPSGYPAGSYPSNSSGGVTALTDTFTTTNWPGFDINALRAPNQAANSIYTNATAPTVAGTGSSETVTAPTINATTNNNSYFYVPLTAAYAVCTGAIATTTCPHFLLAYWNESTSAIIYKYSLN
jgi:type IV pilus assembly protein PilA